MADCSSNALLIQAREYQGLDNRQLWIVVAQLMCNWLRQNNPMAQCDAKSLLEAACVSKINCLQNRDLMIVMAQLLCEILMSGGGGGSSCIVCGDTNPSADPNCPCALGYNKLTGSFFIWDNDFAVWRPIIA